MRWVHIAGEVDRASIPLLQTELSIPPTFLMHILQQTSGDDPHFAGCSIILSHPGMPKTCVCMSFGAPLTQHVDPHSIDVARMWIHVIMVNRTVVSFTRCGGVSFTRIFSSTEHRASMYMDESGIRSKVLELMDKEEWEEHDGAWFLLTRILWAVQLELVSPMAAIQEQVIERTWTQCQSHLSNKESTQDSHQMMHDVYILLQRATVMMMLGNAFKEALEELVEDEYDTRAEWSDQLLRADIKSILLAAKNTTKEFESHVSMMNRITEMWTKRQDLGHVQVNTLLAMVATIFLPLTFLCGVYGMNFTTDQGAVAIPMLLLGDGFWGYILYWGLCISFMLLLLFVFYRKGWFALVGISTTSSVAFTIAASVFLTVFTPVLELCFYQAGIGH